ncbi:MAG TPA: hypothetical protein PK191_04250 [Niabella sp.]|nr:hypothetical protein [Niabella sp.]HQW15692.1 hypothetical protein [Niabella sp.]HQX20791.1 hypothetical protein [Niabella sp.]HRB49582.1 hypothetical protein [Niabella sp.]HRB51506.1 hypothetical protein [Niabella sp.]
MVIAGIALYFYMQSSDLTADFKMAFAFFALLFAFMQFIFIIQILQIGGTENLNIILARVLMVFGYGIFGIVLLYSNAQQSGSTFLINLIGIGPLLAGIALLSFSVRMYMITKSTKRLVQKLYNIINIPIFLTVMQP